jgi:predicted MFS family arabinose efflux permease
MVLFALMPESLDYLMERRPRRALERVNALLAKLDVAPLDALPGRRPKSKASTSATLPPTMLANTALISLAFFLLMFSFYFLTSWTPKLLTDFGLSRRIGVSGSVFMNLGGIVGDGVFALLMMRYPARKVGPPFLVGAFLAAVAFAVVPLNIGVLMPNAFVLGALLFGAMASLYAISPTLFAASVRTTGTGMALGLGRIGAALGPSVGGLLIAQHWPRLAYLGLMSAPLIACALVALVLSEKAKHGLPEAGRL